jgi:hypothetical protein
MAWHAVTCLVPVQELQALDSELRETTEQQQADPFLLYLYGLVQIDRCLLTFLLSAVHSLQLPVLIARLSSSLHTYSTLR